MAVHYNWCVYNDKDLYNSAVVKANFSSGGGGGGGGEA